MHENKEQKTNTLIKLIGFGLFILISIFGSRAVLADPAYVTYKYYCKDGAKIQILQRVDLLKLDFHVEEIFCSDGGYVYSEGDASRLNPRPKANEFTTISYKCARKGADHKPEAFRSQLDKKNPLFKCPRGNDRELVLREDILSSGKITYIDNKPVAQPNSPPADSEDGSGGGGSTTSPSPGGSGGSVAQTPDPCAGIANPDAADRCRSQLSNGGDPAGDLGPSDPALGAGGTHDCGGVEIGFSVGCKDTGNPITDYLAAILSFLARGVGLVVTLMIVIAGIQYITSAGNPQGIEAAKKRLANAIIALLLFIFMAAILNFLVPGGIL